MTLIVAHRGVRSLAPENSLEAFRLCQVHGVPWVELDVQALGDGTPVVFHDLDLERMFADPRTLAQLRLADLGQLRFANGESLPTLEQVMQLLAAQGTHLNLELKADGSNPQALAESLLPFIDAWPAHLELVVSCFDWQLLALLRQWRPKLKLGGLLAEPIGHADLQRAEELKLYSLHPHWSHLSAYWCQQLQQQGLRTFVWTINEPELIDSLWRWGLDAAISDWPQRFLAGKLE